METLNVHAAKTQLSRLLDRVESGEEIVIARNNRPVARLVAYADDIVRSPGRLRGRLTIAEDFDDPLPDELLEVFGGGPTSGDHSAEQHQVP